MTTAPSPAECRDRWYIVRMFVVSIATLTFFMAGTAFMNLSHLGTASISAPMLALSKFTPLSFGTWFFILNGLYFIVQLLLLRRNFPRSGWLQIPVTLYASVMLDVWVHLLHPVADAMTVNYGGKLLVAVIGMLIVAVSLSLVVAANVLYMPADGIVNAMASVFGMRFSKVKLGFDLFCVIVTVALTLALLDKFDTVREATLISALVGPIMGRVLPTMERFIGARRPGSDP